MRGKTILLITNQLQFLQYCDSVVALRHGRIVEQGSYADLRDDENGEVNRLLKEHASKSHKSSKETGDVVKKDKSAREDSDTKDVKTPNEPKKEAAALVTTEERMIGAVSSSVYRKYLQAGGGYLIFSFCYFIFVISGLNSLAITSWISYWTSDAPEYEKHPEEFYIGIYGGIAVMLGIVTFFRSYLLVRFGIRASKTLHANLLNSVLRAPLSFFDTTPIGRILSRFSKDLYSIDVEVADMFDFFLSMTLQVALSLGTILFVTPWFGVAIIPLGFFYFRVLNYFRMVSRETKRLESISRSPVYSQFSETLGGLTTIRAYGLAQRFMGQFETKLDSNTCAYYNNKSADRWLSARLELIGSIIAGSAGLFASNVAISNSATGQSSSSNFASLAGLSLTQAISVTGLLNWCVRSFAQLEAGMNAVERVLYYTESIPQEAAWTSEELEDRYKSSDQPPPTSNPSLYALAANDGKAASFSSDWPENGAITLRNLQMRYRTETPLVLKGLNASIVGGERVGVVGRSGSGKSSLMISLLRLVEPSLESMEKYEPPIEVDGVDVLRIGIRELRSRLGIIPQNPVLFSGTVRSNIDPFDEYTDEQVWNALEQCGLKDSVEEMPGALDAAIAEYGENLSAGMRQMLVLGRALLRQCRIFLLDEGLFCFELRRRTTDRLFCFFFSF